MSRPGLRRRRGRRPGRAWLASAGLATLLVAGVSRAAPPIHVNLPTIAAPPGATVLIPITVDQSLAPYNVTSIGYQLTLDPSRISGASFSLGSGLMATWGTPFSNATPTVAASLAVGFAPLGSSATLIQNVLLTVSASAPIGANIPLAFRSFTLNDGSPAVVLGTGAIQVSNAAGVEGSPGAALALGAPSPNPMRSEACFSLWIPDGGPAARTRVAVLDVSGRRIRELADAALPAGRFDLSWDGRDAGGATVAAGAYWLDLERGGVRRRQRLVVLR